MGGLMNSSNFSKVQTSCSLLSRFPPNFPFFYFPIKVIMTCVYGGFMDSSICLLVAAAMAALGSNQTKTPGYLSDWARHIFDKHIPLFPVPPILSKEEAQQSNHRTSKNGN